MIRSMNIDGNAKIRSSTENRSIGINPLVMPRRGPMIPDAISVKPKITKKT